MNTHQDEREFTPDEFKNDYYFIHVDLSDYVTGYGNDAKVFKAIKKASGVDNWEFVDVRNEILTMKTKQKFNPFKLDLGLVQLVRIK
jgi:hypothetical protein